MMDQAQRKGKRMWLIECTCGVQRWRIPSDVVKRKSVGDVCCHKARGSERRGRSYGQPSAAMLQESVTSLVRLAFQVVDRDFGKLGRVERQRYVELYLQRALDEVQG